MKRQEPRVERVGEYEFNFGECWESDPHNPQAPERHWFRAPNGMEASTSDEILDKLCGRSGVRPSTQSSAPTEWDRRVGYAVRVKDKDVLIDIIEQYTSENGALVSFNVRGRTDW